MQNVMAIESATVLLDYLPDGLSARHNVDDNLPDTVLGSDATAIEAFPQRLLRALATMAVCSKRRQADLAAALCRGGLEDEAHSVGSALQTLETQGFIEQIVPLYDGGVLLAVTSRGIEQLSTMPRWAMMDGAMRLG